MKNVLLIGDSIRKGYDVAVQNSLKPYAAVYFPKENCRFAAYVLRYVHEYKKLVPDGNVDVIHWNAGLWDCLRIYEEDPHTPLDVYAYYIERICIRIKKVFPEATVIFATSTSVLSEQMGKNFKRYNEEIEEYNKCAIEVVKKYGFIVNDLYAASLTLGEEGHSDPVHYYTPVGTEVFANQVISHIAAALDITEDVSYKEYLYTDEPIGI